MCPQRTPCGMRRANAQGKFLMAVPSRILNLFAGEASSTRSPRRSRRPTHALRPRGEVLEARLVLSTRTWSGLGIDTNWTTAANWRQGLVPSANDDLVFPAGSL